MSGTHGDRRVRRTRELLRRALLELILEKGYDSTTVQDILDRADVGRTTFYNHYQTKDELLLSGLDELRTALGAHPATSADSPGGQEPLLGTLHPLFEHAADNRALFRAMLGSRGATLATRAGSRMLSEFLDARLRPRLSVHDPVQLDMTVAFLVNGLLGLLTWWLDKQPDLTVDDVCARFQRLATLGIDPARPITCSPTRAPT